MAIIDSIIIKNIKLEKINENDFIKIGYLFLLLEIRYGKLFNLLLEEMEMAMSNGRLIFITKSNNFASWSIEIQERNYSDYLFPALTYEKVQYEITKFTEY